ncbi:MAG: inverse autotransporter beta domain-containing protein, partial [Proteobacteria bacterium]|nr:inverse autotransporter beta domain-containing protein [Pseudomonadota bacterium]
MRPTKKNKVLHPVPSLVFTSILIATTAAPAWALGGPWKPRQTLNVQGGHGMQGYYDALLPLVGDAEHMFYANGALAGTHHENGGDLGLGYRRIILNNQYVAGGFVLMGRYRTNYHNMFNQLTLGTELFGTTWEARAHLYPLIGKRNKFVSKRSEGFSFQGHKLLGIETTTYEHAEGGGDIEIGRVIPNVPKLRGFAGYYHNGLGNNEHKNVNGGYGRFEYRYNSHFTFTLADAYDRYQGNFFAIGVRINIGAPAENKEPLTADQRMTDYSVRRRNIFTYTTANSIPFSSTENFYFVAGPSLSGDGSYEAPYGSIQEAIAAANADPSSNNYVYVCNCSNTASYTYDLGGQLDIGPTTKLIGSGGTFTYNNTVVPSLCGNARPTLIGGLLLPGNNEVTNFNITGIGAPTNQTTAITVNGGNVSLNNLDIYGYTGGPSIAGIDGINPGDSGTAATPGTAAYGILVNNASNVLINQVNISNINGSSGANGGNGADGTSFPTDTNGGNGGNGASGTAAYGIMLNNSSSVLIS